MPYYIRDPKRDHHFDNHPFEDRQHEGFLGVCLGFTGLLFRALFIRVFMVALQGFMRMDAVCKRRSLQRIVSRAARFWYYSFSGCIGTGASVGAFCWDFGKVIKLLYGSAHSPLWRRSEYFAAVGPHSPYELT